MTDRRCREDRGRRRGRGDRRRLAVAGVVFVLAAAACTSGSDSGSSPTTAPPKQNLQMTAAVDSAAERADAMLATLTLAQKEQLVLGVGLPELGVPAFAMGDGPNGIRNVGIDGKATGGTVTEFPAAVNVAASWDPSLARTYGDALGAEAAGRGKNTLLGPTVNIVRTPLWGRSAETFGEDPYLSGQIVAPEIEAIQAHGVATTVKHYLANNQETNRFGEPASSPAVDVQISERALREIYMPAFKAAFQDGGSMSVMCSYNRVLGQLACQNGETLGVLREWGFRGAVIPDAVFAVEDPVVAFNAGLDIFGTKGAAGAPDLDAAISGGQISMDRLDEAARNVLITVFATGMDSKPYGTKDDDVSTAEHRDLAADIAAQGSVLLKNDGEALPFDDSVRSIAVIGHDADPVPSGTSEGGSPHVVPAPGTVVTPIAGITERAGSDRDVSFAAGTVGDAPLPVLTGDVLSPATGTGPGLLAEYFAGEAPEGTPVVSRIVPGIDVDSGPPEVSGGWSARWTGTITPQESGTYYFSARPTGGGVQLFIDGKPVASGSSEGPLAQLGGAPLSFHGRADLEAGKPVDVRVEFTSAPGLSAGVQVGWQTPSESKIAEAVAAAKDADAAVVFVNSLTSEGTDRSTLALPGDQDELIEAVAAVNPRTVVVVHSAGPVLMPWLSKVAGVVEAWYGGQEGGTAIAKVLFGDVNPSGKLPVTFPASDDQGPGQTPEEFPGVDDVVDYSEGLQVGYRYFDANGQTPLFPFGYGLSYTSFALSDLRVSGDGANRTVEVKVANTGALQGSQVVQVYLRHPDGSGEPIGLVGFGKVSLAPGESTTVTLTLTSNSFETWDEASRAAVVQSGDYQILVGTSATDLPLKEQITIR